MGGANTGVPKSVLTINEAVSRARSEGFMISSYSLRRWIKTGAVPVRKAGSRMLLYYPNLVRFLQGENGGDNAPATVIPSGIRRVDL